MAISSQVFQHENIGGLFTPMYSILMYQLGGNRGTGRVFLRGAYCDGSAHGEGDR